MRAPCWKVTLGVLLVERGFLCSVDNWRHMSRASCEHSTIAASCFQLQKGCPKAQHVFEGGKMLVCRALLLQQFCRFLGLLRGTAL